MSEIYADGVQTLRDRYRPRWDRPPTEPDAWLDPIWRRNNLYWQVDKDGKLFRFGYREGMWRLWLERHYRTLILKARQYGFTTQMVVDNLDDALFIPNTRVDFIADTRSNAEEIFTDKVSLAWNHFCMAPQGHPHHEAFNDIGLSIKESLKTKVDRADMLRFANGSSFRVAVSSRGGTVQRLHVSEYGKIAAHHPQKAIEIQRGAFNAVPHNGVITIESTAEGQEGAFYDMVKAAQTLGHRSPAAIEFKLFFHPWWQDPEYRLTTQLPIPSRLSDYFEEIESKEGIVLTPEQKRWYTAIEATQGEGMWAEYPSYADEAFKVSLEGAYLKHEMRAARLEGRIGLVPYQHGLPVHTAWDIGVNDDTAIWFFQQWGLQWRFIDYYSNSGFGSDHYVAEIHNRRDRFDWLFGTHLLPHDARVREWGNAGKDRVQSLKADGLHGIETVQPPRDKIAVGVGGMRKIFGAVWIDEEQCSEGIACLDNFRREWDSNLGTWKDSPLRNWAKHGADAFQTFALGYAKIAGPDYPHNAFVQPQFSPRAWT